MLEESQAVEIQVKLKRQCESWFYNEIWQAEEKKKKDNEIIKRYIQIFYSCFPCDWTFWDDAILITFTCGTTAPSAGLMFLWIFFYLFL